MKLIRLKRDGTETMIADAPKGIHGSFAAMRSFLAKHGEEQFGRNYRICNSPDPHCLAPLFVNEIVFDANGNADTGDCLVIQ